MKVTYMCRPIGWVFDADFALSQGVITLIALAQGTILKKSALSQGVTFTFMGGKRNDIVFEDHDSR